MVAVAFTKQGVELDNGGVEGFCCLPNHLAMLLCIMFACTEELSCHQYQVSDPLNKGSSRVATAAMRCGSYGQD